MNEFYSIDFEELTGDIKTYKVDGYLISRNEHNDVSIIDPDNETLFTDYQDFIVEAAAYYIQNNDNHPLFGVLLHANCITNTQYYKDLEIETFNQRKYLVQNQLRKLRSFIQHSNEFNNNHMNEINNIIEQTYNTFKNLNYENN
jgi:hypothetical protein